MKSIMMRTGLRQQRFQQLAIGMLMMGMLISPSLQQVLACPFCAAPSLTLSEQVASSQAALLVQWAGGEKADHDQDFAGTTDYEIVKIVQDESQKLKVGEKIRVDRYREAAQGDLFLLLGTKIEGELEWNSPLEVTETSFNYMIQSPSRESDSVERMAYFLRFLEYSDPLIANDAFSEFANSTYDDVVGLRDKMSREKLRGWLSDPQVSPTRIGLYGMMLGLCGQEEDVEFLRSKILEETEDFRLGIDGVMGGYLLLTGTEGLQTLNEAKLLNEKVPFSETFAAMQALRFMWTYGKGQIPADDLRASMRLLLDRPNLADLVIVDLARWQDWSIMDRLMDLYNQPAYDVPSIKRAIVRFMLIAEKEDKPTTVNGQEISPAADAKKNLDHLRQTDEKTVKAAERYFFD